jgi:hypothetical protein
MSATVDDTVDRRNFEIYVEKGPGVANLSGASSTVSFTKMGVACSWRVGAAGGFAGSGDKEVMINSANVFVPAGLRWWCSTNGSKTVAVEFRIQKFG